MKRKILIFLAALLCITALLASCGGSSDCLGHVDDNGDNKCDDCSATIAVCKAHVDDNDDAKCDVCKRAVVKVEVPKGNETDLVVKPLPESGKLTDYLITEFESGTYVLAAPKELTIGGEIIDVYAAIIDDCAHVDRYDQIGQPVSDNACDKCGDVMTFTNDERFILVIKAVNTVGEGEGAVTTTTYTAYDAMAEKVLYTVSYDDSDANKTTSVNIILENFGFLIYNRVTVFTPPVEPETEGTTEKTFYCEAYTYAGEKFYSYVANETPDIDSVTPEEPDNGIWYVEIEETVYAIDNLTGKLLHQESKDIFVPRPEFDRTVGGYGVVEITEPSMLGEAVTKLYVYDLSKWLSCVFTYELPDDASMAMSFCLDNGNLLIQYLSLLDANAQKYDVNLGENKANLTYVYVDIAKLTATEVDFGYFILSCQNGEGIDLLYKDNVQNVMQVAPIIDGTLDITKADTALIVDNDLTIKFACDVYSIPAQNGPLFVVGDNRYATSFVYGDDGKETWAIVDENLEIVCYLPDPFAVMVNGVAQPLSPFVYRDGFIVKGTKIFNLDMELVIDYAEEGYSLSYSHGGVYTSGDFVNFFLLEKTFVTEDNPETPENEYSSVTKLYFFDPAETAAPVEITGEIVDIDEMTQYLVIKNTVAGVDGAPDTYTYDLLDANGKVLLAGLESYPNLTRSAGLSYITVEAGGKYYLINTSILGK